MICGIYSILDKATRKKYIGQSINIEKRWRTHKRLLKKSAHFNVYLQRAWNKRSAANFEFLVLEEVNDRNKLSEREGYWVKRWKTLDKNFGYNIQGVDEQGKYFISLETRKKIAKTLTGFKHSEETKQKQSEINKKRIFSEEQKRNISKAISEALTDRKKTKIHRLALREVYTKKRIIKKLEGKNRQISEKLRGEKGTLSKLTWKKVEEIRRRYKEEDITLRTLAKQYDIDCSNISRVINHVTWRTEDA